MSTDDATLMAYADGELTGAQKAMVEAAIATDPALAARVEAHRALRARIAANYAPVAEEAVPDRFAALLGAGQPVAAELVDFTAFRAERTMQAEQAKARRLPVWANVAAIAATLVLGVAVGRFAMTPGGPIDASGGTMMARGELAMALNDGLASRPSNAADATRIGLSFRDRQGRYCRSFDGAGVAGLACRDGKGWQVEQAVKAARQDSGYRQASSLDERIMASVSAMIDGTPLNAQQEEAARDKGWK